MEEKQKKTAKKQEPEKFIKGVDVYKCEDLQKNGYKVIGIYYKGKKLLYDLELK